MQAHDIKRSNRSKSHLVLERFLHVAFMTHALPLAGTTLFAALASCVLRRVFLSFLHCQRHGWTDGRTFLAMAWILV